MQQNRSKGAFTIVELIVVVSILALLSGVLVPRINDHVQGSRDSQRLDDVARMRNAIEQFYMDRGRFPAPVENSKYAGWDVSHDDTFISELVTAGYMERVPTDPRNDEQFHYRYYVYEPGAYGCRGKSPFYVLGVKAFESAGFASRNRGFFRCETRDWSREFAFVTGGGARLKR